MESTQESTETRDLHPGHGTGCGIRQGHSCSITCESRKPPISAVERLRLLDHSPLTEAQRRIALSAIVPGVRREADQLERRASELAEAWGDKRTARALRDRAAQLRELAERDAAEVLLRVEVLGAVVFHEEPKLGVE